MANNSLSFLLGAAIGAAATAWLLTTDKGKEVLAKAGDWADKAQGAAKDLAGKAQDAFEEAKAKL